MNEPSENVYTAGQGVGDIMKTRISLLLVALAVSLAWLGVGFYKTYFAEDNRLVFFIKKHPTFQVRFENIYASDQDDKPLERLNDEERQVVIAYCKYRLGIRTELNSQAELEMCKQR
ncbi:MAG: hypothetical protein ACN6O6_06165 [Pseudomonas sp.]|uniref:hypothetical protein n=1 Tax=Pseudomonas sp. TaxID=306 RepID=UPI003D12B2D3